MGHKFCIELSVLALFCDNVQIGKTPLFSSPGQSPRRTIVLPPALAAAAAAVAAVLAKSLTLKFFM